LPAPSIDVERAERLVLKAGSGDGAAFNELVTLIWPGLSQSMKRSRRLASAGADEDGAHDVALRIIEKLRARDFHALSLFSSWHSRHPEKTVLDWLRIVSANVTRDYLRELRGHTTRTELPTPKQLLNAFSAVISEEDLGTRPPVTRAQTARQLLEFAESRLDPVQLSALREWLTGASFAEIGTGLGNTEDGARRSVRAALAVLRREFGRS
jgi:DNA-directed RNA polymerase specialized sigma24 family protein